MNRISPLALSLVVLASTLTAPAAAVAAVPITSPVHALFSNSRQIRFALRNDSSASIDLKAGDITMTLPAGKTLSLNLPVGTRVETASPTSTRPAGDLVAQVSPALKNTTIVLH